MDIMIIILLCILLTILWLTADYYKDDASKERMLSNTLLQRQRIAERIVMECYCRLYKQDDFIRRDEMLINLLDLLNVYGISSQVGAQENRVVQPDEQESEHDCTTCKAVRS